ncbi:MULTISPECIES: DNA starvation/stationary phase protection protein Dps [Kordiimonas]|jgi:starvation-inducible DNA-binding protein|uniref:DNA starvation/stationary phase protection protein Dps n=1 Tax=Kordiimonas TaxID=288021 RepID=UPI00257C31F1|nr:DNA starvation/stationary phase protection protein Dps [Kordiimonas sp. UBA4487]
MQRTRNLLSEGIRIQSIELLNQYLAASIDLHGQMRQAHWNVRGPGFVELHRLFDQIAREVDGFANRMAERAGSIGGTAEGTVQAAVKKSFLPQYPLGIADSQKHVAAVSDVLSIYCQAAHEASDRAAAFGDINTADLLTEISRNIDHQLWQVESNEVPK